MKGLWSKVSVKVVIFSKLVLVDKVTYELEITY